MKRTNLASIATETVSICDAGQYQAPSGKRIHLAEAINHAVGATTVYSTPSLPSLSPEQTAVETKIEVANETTFQGLTRLTASGAHIGCLNFASARNPGGGFLGGAQAQEEALARASALYPCLLAAPEYYARNRSNRSAVYLDLAIFSPKVPFFRNDAGTLLEEPLLASVITAPAPNRGAVAQNEPENLPLVVDALRRRAEMVLHIAQANEIEGLVLGAWGCGVFRNEPAIVASIFAELIKPRGRFAGVFRRVLFAVYDRTESRSTLHAFENAFR